MSGEGEGDSTKANVPKWLTGEIFEKLLRDHVKGYKTIKHFEVASAMALNEIYSTKILRICIDVDLEEGETQTVSYVMKVPTDNEEKSNRLDYERRMYLEIVEEFEQMYREVGVDLKFKADCYQLDDPQGSRAVLLEDLCGRGFKTTDRLEGLDKNHMNWALRKLAQYHAASATRVATKGPYDEKLSMGFFTDDNYPTMKAAYTPVYRSFINAAKSYNGHEAYYADLEPLAENGVRQLFKMGVVDDDEFNVLNHGDLWTNNIMYQYDEAGDIKDLYFVDYHGSKWGSPAQDLIYFILSSSKFELKLKQFDYFIKYYHDQLMEHLELLKYPKKLPTLKELHTSLYRYAFWGVHTILFVMAAALLEPNEDANLRNFTGDSEDSEKFRQLMFTNDRYRKHIEAILPWLQNRGALDC